MRIVSYRRDDGAVRTGLVEGDAVRDADGPVWDPQPRDLAGPLDALPRRAPVPSPGKVVCVGRNYAEHAAETGSAVPTEPQLFAKWANAVVADGDDVVLHPITQALDYEAELVAVIGTTACRIPESRALDHVLGYTCGNDVSARDLQFGDTQWTRGKALDSFAPMGPWIVTADEIPDPTRLHLMTRLNGREVQHTGIDDLIFDIPTLISYCSDWTPLVAGDVISTGTPEGVGFARKPPLWMKPGDVVEGEIDGGVGVLRNPIIAEA